MPSCCCGPATFWCSTRSPAWCSIRCGTGSPKALFATAGLVFAYLAMFYVLLFYLLSTWPEQAEAINARIAAGEAISAADRTLLADWADLKRDFHPPQEALDREVTKFHGTYAESFAANAEELGRLYALYPLFLFWDALACMVLGMALYKTGVLRGRRSARFYVWLAACGFAVGAAVNAFELWMKVGSGFALQWVSGGSMFTNDLGRVSMALGFVGVVMIVCQRGWWPRARSALAAVGRMALTNYLLQSVFGLLVFHSFVFGAHTLGFGLWNELPRHQLYLVVLGEWAAAIAFSLWWMRRFRFGPLEWLWRALTYGGLPKKGASDDVR